MYHWLIIALKLSIDSELLRIKLRLIVQMGPFIYVVQMLYVSSRNLIEPYK